MKCQLMHAEIKYAKDPKMMLYITQIYKNVHVHIHVRVHEPTLPVLTSSLLIREAVLSFPTHNNI